MGHTHAVGWSATDATIVGVVGLDRPKSEKFAAAFGVQAFESLDAVLPQVDVVDICVPTHLHLDFTLKAATAGKHVLCEKPIARSLEDAQKMIMACREANVRLFVGMTVRFFPQYRGIYDAVRAGKVGSPGVIRLTRATYRPHSAHDDWFSDFARSGGPILDTLIHDYDYARWLGGDVERVYARGSAPDAGGIAEYVQVLLRFRSGALGHVEGGWAYPPPLFRTKVEVAGDGGLIEWESDTSAPLVTYTEPEPGAVADVGLPLSPLAEDPYTTMIKHFYDSLMHDKPFAVTANDALSALQIGLAAIESMRSGLPVNLAPLPVQPEAA